MIERLREYVNDSPCTVSLEEIEKLLIEADHLKVVISIIDLFLLKSDTKKKAIWMWGEHNSGKTRLLKLLKLIFHCHKYEETNSHFCVQIARAQFKTQIVLIDEGALDTMFNKRKLN